MPQRTAPLFALNHMAAPAMPVASLLALAARLGVGAVELRNDLDGQSLAPASAREQADRAGIRILSINALQRFNDWTEARRDEAERLAKAAAGCGAAALVLCPVNQAGFAPEPRDRAERLVTALAGLAPILRRHGLKGFVEPLGFAECSLRTKREAVVAIDAADGAELFALVHDTFHHHVSGETELFARHTGLVHISGVSDPGVTAATMRDRHRVLVDADDRIDTLGQIAALRGSGYDGAFSFEPFAPSVHGAPDIAAELSASMDWIRAARTPTR